MAHEPAQKQACLFDGSKGAEPVLVSACLLGIPCRWHGRRPKKRKELIKRLGQRYVLVPICPEQLGSMVGMVSRVGVPDTAHGACGLHGVPPGGLCRGRARRMITP
jgi:hypothetical protein